ncbi:MAG: tRNA lysidine(34) synthetase TilS [Treponema sp.]|nr:tRNA lysidine(34) synthetase TilS [Candidatus Treponema caballi]
MKADVTLEDYVRSSLEQKLKELSSSSVPVVLATVSGGIDSMVMLSVLKRLSETLSFSLAAVTVNHNIRPEEETAGDAALVAGYCLQLCVPCTVTTLPKGEVEQTACERKNGIEEAARYLRYQAFERAASDSGSCLVCIAHNRNDRLETLLERFFQGTAGIGASGMQMSRGMYYRPLFNVTRTEIEAYATEYGVPFRTDATNTDNRYYRNRIRNELMPLLDSLIPGWDTAVLHGAEKNALISSALEKHAASATWKAETADKAEDACKAGNARAVVCREDEFNALECAERIQALYNGLNVLKSDQRVPFEMLRAIADGAGKAEGAGVSLERERGSIVIRKDCDVEIDGFYCVVRQEGRYCLPCGEIIIRECKEQVCENAFYAENIKNGAFSGIFRLPVVIRSRQPSDCILDKSGGHKEVSKLFSEWHVPEAYDALLPLFDDGEVQGVWGSVFGYPDYFVTIPEDISET